MSAAATECRTQSYAARLRLSFHRRKGILVRAHLALMIDTPWEQIFMRRSSPGLEPGDQGRTDVCRDLELDRAIGLLLGHDGTVPKVRSGNHIANLDLRQIAAAELTVDGEIEEGFVPQPSFSIKLLRMRPLRSAILTGVPGRAMPRHRSKS